MRNQNKFGNLYSKVLLIIIDNDRLLSKHAQKPFEKEQFFYGKMPKTRKSHQITMDMEQYSYELGT